MSHKELIKAINTHISINAFPLPDELLETIQAYLDKHYPIEDSESQRLQDELVNIYQKEVRDKPALYPTFMAMLRRLRPAITSSTRLIRWWEILVMPVLDNLTAERGLAFETRGILLEILVYDTDEGDVTDAVHTSAVLSERLLEMWLKSNKDALKPDPAAHFLEQQIQQVLVEFGKKRPKDFLMTLNKFFVNKDHRLQVLSLVCEFIRHGPPHLHQLLQTPLFENLLLCLQIDTSTTVISLALTALIMFLPHIPNSIAPHLPSLFKIYSRILFWDRERAAPSADPDQLDSEKPTDGSDDIFEDSQWEKMAYSAGSDGETVPELLHYFTFLYGLYPINLMSYIRKPSRYLRHANLSDAEDIDVQPSEIWQRSGSFRQLHLLHPNFYTMTIESEVKNKNRWMNSEAADVVASCIALRGPSITQPFPMTKPPEVTISQQLSDGIPDQPLLGSSEEPAESRLVSEVVEARDPSWRNTMSTIVASSESGDCRKLSQGSQPTRIYDDSPTLKPQNERLDSPTLPPQLLTDSHAQQEESLLARNSLYESANESEVSMLSNIQAREPSIVSSYLQSLAQHQMAHSASSGQSPSDETPDIASLHREIMLLKNDLNFERYLKQQHLSHIGQLRSKHVREATAEAETQHLINSNKGLRNKLEDAKSSALRMKKESEKSRIYSKKWEAELTAKLRALREEQKKSRLEIETLRRDLACAQENCLQLRQLVVASEAKELGARQKLQSIEVALGEHDKLRAEVEKLTATVRSYEAAEMENEGARASEASAMTKVEILEMKLRAREVEMLEARLATDDEIESLKTKLREATQSLSNAAPGGWQSMLDNALASSRAKLMESQKAHAHLLLKFTNLQAQYLALQSNQDLDEPLLSSGEFHSRYDMEYSYLGSAPDHRRMRPRGLSDPNAFDRSPYDLSSPSGSTAYAPIRPAPKAETSSPNRDIRPISQNGYHSPHQRLTSSELVQHVTHHSRAGSTDGSQRLSEERDSNGQLKIKPQSEIRVYGRGGVQNIGKKEKEKKDKKTPGLRGLRGLATN